MSQTIQVLAFDFGASSGRAILGSLCNDRIELKDVHRFSNDPVQLADTLYWDFPRLVHEMKQGLIQARQIDNFSSVGIDTWGVDFAFLDASGYLLDQPVHYRDPRTLPYLSEIDDLFQNPNLYQLSGIQKLPFNSIYQLYTTRKMRPDLFARARHALFMPDLLAYFLTGVKACEYTIASTSALLDPQKRNFNPLICQTLGLPSDLFPELVYPGLHADLLHEQICRETGIQAVPLVRVASHDTASAVVSVPAENDNFVYLSSGTWSLMGVESEHPIITPASERLMFTNEGGFSGRIRFLKNIMGLWLIQESRRQWQREGIQLSYSDLERAALIERPFQSLIDPDAARYAQPGDLPKHIRQQCRETKQPVPETIGQVVRCIYESLALKYRSCKSSLERMMGRQYPVIHVVGGGAKDDLLSQFTANASASTVIAGPIEASALGNIAVQLIHAGALPDLPTARRLIARSFPPKTFHPQVELQAQWDEAYDLFQRLFPAPPSHLD